MLHRFVSPFLSRFCLFRSSFSPFPSRFRPVFLALVTGVFGFGHRFFASGSGFYVL
jgi:hypothetical protein